MPHDAFNANFYITAATIIPVLYLALTLQGTTVRRLMERGIDQSYKVLMLEPKKEQNRNWAQRQAEMWGRAILGTAFIYTDMTIFFAGFIGELIAIIALFHESASPLSGDFVLGATIGLLAVIAASQLFIIATGPSLTKRLNKEKEQGSGEPTKNRNDSDSAADGARPDQSSNVEQSAKSPHGRHEKTS